MEFQSKKKEKKSCVLTINKMFPPEIGGVENVALEITRLAIEKGFLSRVLTFSKDSRTVIERQEGSLVVRCGVFYRRDPVRISLLWENLYKRISNGVDIEIFHVPSGLPELLCMKKLLNKKRIVLYHADTVGEGLFRQIYREKVLPSFLDTADLIVATSEKIIKTSSVLARFSDKCKVVPLFVDTVHFTPEGEVFDFKGAFTRDKIVILYVGRFGRYKGLQYLIKALNLLDDKFHLVLVGNGPERGSIELLINKLNLGERVTVMPHVGYDKLPSVYRSADVFVLPSTDRGEAFGLVALEAMACGVPVITTELGTGTTLANIHGVTGYHVPPKDEQSLAKAISLSAEAFAKKRKVSEIIRARAEEFSKEKFANAWGNILEMALLDKGQQAN